MAFTNKPTVSVTGLPKQEIAKAILLKISGKLCKKEYHVDADNIYMEIHSSEVTGPSGEGISFYEFDDATDELTGITINFEDLISEHFELFKIFKAFSFKNNTLSIHFFKENFYLVDILTDSLTWNN